MPHYSWRGVDLSASLCKGIHFARSEQELDALLLQRDIALLSCKPVRQWFTRPIKKEQKISFFRQLAILVHAGIPLTRALRLVGDRSDHREFGAMIHTLADMVEEGISLSEAMGHFTNVFNGTMVAMIEVGLETGSLPTVFELIAEYLESRKNFTQSIRSVLMMPIITLTFFTLVTIGILVLLVPRFAELMHSINRAIPTSMQTLLIMRSFVCSWYSAAAFMVALIVILMSIQWARTAYGLRKITEMALKIPLIKTIVVYSALKSYFQALHLLLHGGVPLVPALRLSHMTIHSPILQERFGVITENVAHGFSLSQSMASHLPDLISSESIAMLMVGEETGLLSSILAQIAQEYQNRVHKYLRRITTIIQPLLLLLLGILVTLLVIALYAPIFNLSYMV